MTFTVLYWLIVGGVITAIVIKRDKDNQKWMVENLALAEEEFRKMHVHSSNPQLILDAMTAEVMDDKPEVIANGYRYLTGYALNRIVRNDSGEYFWLHYDSVGEPKAIVKHMEHSLAKVLLKEKYIAP